MEPSAVRCQSLSKVFRLYPSPFEKALDIFGLNHLMFWRNPRFEEFWALRDISLEVPKGQRLGIIGSNGAGKSTLLKIIAGNTAPTNGHIDVQGTVQSLMILGVGFHPDFTGRQNIRAALTLQGFSTLEIDEREAEIIDFSELGVFIDQPVRTYSAGMYARLSFSTATSTTPDILIIDEILGAGDAYFAGKSLQRMRTLTEESGATVLLVSHDMACIQAFSQRVVWIDQGLIKADGAPLEVCKAYYKHQQERENRSRAMCVSQGTENSSKEKPTRIESVRFLNDQDEVIHGIEEGESLIVELTYYSERRIDRPEFAMTFYGFDGQRICHANTAIAGTSIDSIFGHGSIRFRFDPFPVGPGEYLLSTSIFQYLDLSLVVQPPYYDQHDRAYRLRIWKKLGVSYDLGLIRVGYTVEHCNDEKSLAA